MSKSLNKFWSGKFEVIYAQMFWTKRAEIRVGLQVKFPYLFPDFIQNFNVLRKALWTFPIIQYHESRFMSCYSQRGVKIKVTVLHLFLSHISKISLNEMEWILANTKYLRVKVIPQQADVAQGVPVSLTPRIFLTFCTTMVVGCQPYAPAAFTPEEIPGVHFQGLSRPQGTWFHRGDPWKKIPSDTTGNRSGTVLTTTLLQAQWLRVLLNNGSDENNVPLGTPFSSFPHFILLLTLLGTQGLVFESTCWCSKVCKLFFLLFTAASSNVCMFRIIQFICPLFYKLAFCLHVSSSTDIPAISFTFSVCIKFFLFFPIPTLFVNLPTEVT